MAGTCLPPRPPRRAQVAGRGLEAFREQLGADPEARPVDDERFLTLCAAAVIGADDDHCGGLGLIVAADAVCREDVARLVDHAAAVSRDQCTHVAQADPCCPTCRLISARDRVSRGLPA